MLQSVGALQSMSRTGNCYDNAIGESFFHTLEIELDAHRGYEGRNAARTELFEFIDAFETENVFTQLSGFKVPSSWR